MDEVQYISELFSYIKMECDKTEEKGSFCLTDSQQYHLMKIDSLRRVSGFNRR